MTCIRSFFINALAVFFINRMAPGIEIGLYEQVPNIGADLLFSAIVGLLNAAVFPLLFALAVNPSKLKIGGLTFAISFASFTTIAIFPLGVRAVNAAGVLIAGTFTWLVAFLTNYLEWHQSAKRP